MGLLREISPLVEPLSLDEAFVDLARADLPDLTVPTVTAFAEELRQRVVEVTGGLTASVGVGTSKFIAKVASDLDKPDGLVVVVPGTEQELLRPMDVRVIPGVGPATAERLRRVGVHTVAELERISEDEMVRLLGKASGHWLFQLARADDDRPVVAERETKSVSVEGTYDTDLTDRKLMEGLLTRQAKDVAAPAAQARPVRTHRHDQGADARLHDAEPLLDTRLPHRQRRAPSPGWPASLLDRPRHLRRRPPARRRRLRPRRLGAGGPVRRDDRGGGGAPRGRGARTTRGAPGRPAWTSCTPRWAAAGCGARAGAWSRCGSRPPRRRPARCVATPWTTRSSAPGGRRPRNPRNR